MSPRRAQQLIPGEIVVINRKRVDSKGPQLFIVNGSGVVPSGSRNYPIITGLVIGESSSSSRAAVSPDEIVKSLGCLKLSDLQVYARKLKAK